MSAEDLVIVDLPDGRRLVTDGDRRFIVPAPTPPIIVIPDEAPPPPEGDTA